MQIHAANQAASQAAHTHTHALWAISSRRVVSSRNFRTSVGNIKIATKYKSNLCAPFSISFRCMHMHAAIPLSLSHSVAYKNAFKIAVESMKNACWCARLYAQTAFNLLIQIFWSTQNPHPKIRHLAYPREPLPTAFSPLAAESTI